MIVSSVYRFFPPQKRRRGFC
jgi:hypothetical protein